MKIDQFEGKIESLADQVSDNDIPAAISILFRNAAFLGLDLAFDQSEYNTRGFSQKIALKLLQTLNEEIAKITG